MSKRRILFLKFFIPLCILLLLILSAVIYFVVQKDEFYQKIEFYTDDTGKSGIVYNGIRYDRVNNVCFWEHDADSKLDLISWSWYIYPLGKNIYYADNVENPNYIYCSRWRYSTYVNENLDYMNDEYIVFNYSDNFRKRIDTEFTFKLNDAYYSDESISEFALGIHVAWFCSHSKSCSKLIFRGDIYHKENEYYIYFGDGQTYNAYRLKPEFIGILKEAGIISADL